MALLGGLCGVLGVEAGSGVCRASAFSLAHLRILLTDEEAINAFGNTLLDNCLLVVVCCFVLGPNLTVLEAHSSL